METAGARPNFQFQEERLNKALPESPDRKMLAKLFTPRFVLNVTAPDGTVIPFVYKRMDPGTLLITHGSAISLPVNAREQALLLQTELVRSLQLHHLVERFGCKPG